MQNVNQTLFQLVIMSALVVTLGALEVLKPHGSVAVPEVKVMLIGSAQPEVQAVVFGADYCLPCRTMKKTLKAEMPKDGWKLADAKDPDAAKTAHILFDDRQEQFTKNKIIKIPTVVFFKDGVEVRRIEQPISPDDLAKNYNEVGTK